MDEIERILRSAIGDGPGDPEEILRGAHRTLYRRRRMQRRLALGGFALLSAAGVSLTVAATQDRPENSTTVASSGGLGIGSTSDSVDTTTSLPEQGDPTSMPETTTTIAPAASTTTMGQPSSGPTQGGEVADPFCGLVPQPAEEAGILIGIDQSQSGTIRATIRNNGSSKVTLMTSMGRLDAARVDQSKILTAPAATKAMYTATDIDPGGSHTFDVVLAPVACAEDGMLGNEVALVIGADFTNGDFRWLQGERFTLEQ